jgi:phosphatidate cytidylyltransferase
MLLPRFLTALVGSVILMGSIFMGGLPFLFVVLAIVLIGVREFYTLAEETGYPSYPLIGLMASALLVLSIYINGLSLGQHAENQFTSALIALFLILIVARSLSRGPADTSLSEWSITFMGLFYVSWSLSHLILIRDLRPGGRTITFLLFTMIWMEDIAAYFIGRRWGRHKIAEAISPKKSWQGTIAGLIAAVLVSVFFHYSFLRKELTLLESIGLAILVGIIAFASDLGESILKRGAGLKDSSQLLPGHGGMLDRFDSFILAAPFYYYYWALLKH